MVQRVARLKCNVCGDTDPFQNNIRMYAYTHRGGVYAYACAYAYEYERLGLVVTKSTNLSSILRLIVHSKLLWYQNDG